MTPAADRWSGLAEAPVQVAGVINAYTAMLAERAGFRALYLSGSGVATASFGLPDLGLTTLTEVAEETRRITAATSLPLLVDADTGWGARPMVERAVREFERRTPEVAALTRALGSGLPAVVNVLTDPDVAYPRRSNLA